MKKSNPWKKLLKSLSLFSDDFMSTRNQPSNDVVADASHLNSQKSKRTNDFELLDNDLPSRYESNAVVGKTFTNPSKKTKN